MDPAATFLSCAVTPASSVGDQRKYQPTRMLFLRALR
jgi:hypothetical protein